MVNSLQMCLNSRVSLIVTLPYTTQVSLAIYGHLIFHQFPFWMPFFCCAHSIHVSPSALFLPFVHRKFIEYFTPHSFHALFYPSNTSTQWLEVWSPCVQVSQKITQKDLTTLLRMCVACKVPGVFLNMTLHSVVDISRKRVSSTFSAGTVHLRQADHALTVHRQCMQSHRKGWSNTTTLNSTQYIFHCL